MGALSLALGLFAAWWLIGLGLLALVRGETSDLRIALVAPALGMCVTALSAFVLSEAGLALQDCAVALAAVLLTASAAAIALRRPRVHAGALAVVAVCVAGALLAAWPMFLLGFDWLANGNDDMSNYVLSAQQLLKNGLLASADLRGIAQGRDYATALAGLHLSGARPGSNILLAVASRVSGRPPYQAFMPAIVSFNLCGACAVGALALQAARRWWAAVVAAALLVVAPLATFGVVQQLLAQVWGLGVAAGLLALMLRPELHTGRGARVRDVVPIGVLAAGLVLGYVEVVPVVGLAYLVYLAVLALQRKLELAAAARLLAPVVVIVLVVLNKYMFTELSFVKAQAGAGLKNGTGPPLFGYILVPSGLPGVIGLQTLPPVSFAPYLNLSIGLSAVIIIALLVGCVFGARRAVGAAIMLLVLAALGVLLVNRKNDFGLFKLSMYVQPFLAAALAVWLASMRRRVPQLMVAAVVVVFVVAELSTQHAYVSASRDSESVPQISAADVIPAFHNLANRAKPVVSVTENPVLIKLEAAAANGRPVYFQSRNSFRPLLLEYIDHFSGRRRARLEQQLRSGPWFSRSFNLGTSGASHDKFEEDSTAEMHLSDGDCNLAMAGDNVVPFNRYSLPDPSPDLVISSCDAPRDLLAFTSSQLGESFYLQKVRKNVSFFQLQSDPFFAGRMMVGFGRYAMFQVLGPTPGARLAIEVTDTFNHDGVNLLPPASVLGSKRTSLGLVGNGSARVFSEPLQPQIIAGEPYLLVDMGVEGRLPHVERPGIQRLYSRSVPTDPRYLTSYVRDISLISAKQYASLTPPLALSRFPQDLADPSLEYSGVYEDGWMGRDAFVRLAGGSTADLVIRGIVPAGAGGQLQLFLDGRRLSVLAADPGRLNVRVAVPRSASTRRIELRFSKTIKLRAPDLRPAGAHLTFLGLVSPQSP